MYGGIFFGLNWAQKDPVQGDLHPLAQDIPILVVLLGAFIGIGIYVFSGNGKSLDC